MNRLCLFLLVLPAAGCDSFDARTVLFSDPKSLSFEDRAAELEGLDETGLYADIKDDFIRLKGILDLYRVDTGRYPKSLEVLQKTPQPRSRQPYLTAIPYDPWGRPYLYFAPRTLGEPFVLGSYGKDGEPGGEGQAQDIRYVP